MHKYQKLIKKYRIENNLTQEEMANKLGYTQQNYSNFERGRVKISIKFLENWKNVTGEDLDKQHTPLGEISLLKYHYETILKLLLDQEEKIKMLERELKNIQMINKGPQN